METKNEQQKQNLIWIFIVLVLVIICSLLFLQNKKIEKITTIINMSYDPFRFNFETYRKPNNDIYIIEKRINEKFMEFAREMEELKQIVSETISNDSEGYMERIYNEISKKNETDKKNFDKDAEKDKITRNSKKQESDIKKLKARQKNSHRNDQFDVETNYDKDNKEYKVGIKLPSNLSIDDVRVTLKNSILKIRIEKEFNKEEKDSSYYNYDSFYQSFTIPKTKATTKDIIKKIEDGKLEIKIPVR